MAAAVVELRETSVPEQLCNAAAHAAVDRCGFDRALVFTVGGTELVAQSIDSFFGFPRGLRVPLGTFTPNPATNRRSAKRVGGLGARTILFGHGPPETDGGRFREFCVAL